MLSRAEQLIVVAPRILRQTADIAALRVVTRLRLGGRSADQSLQTLFAIGGTTVVQFLHIQRPLQRHQIADHLLAIRFFFVAH